MITLLQQVNSTGTKSTNRTVCRKGRHIDRKHWTVTFTELSTCAPGRSFEETGTTLPMHR